jgi:hypothetical protein
MAFGMTEQNVPRLLARVPWIIDDPTEWIAEDRRRLLECYPMFREIPGSFLGIPLEPQGHLSPTATRHARNE